MADWDGAGSTYRTLGKCSSGCMPDGSRHLTYYLPDHDYEMRQLRIFEKMVEKGELNLFPIVPPLTTVFYLGLIYRHYRPVYYSPSSHSALAEAELVYKDDHVSHSVYVAFDLDLHSTKASVTLRTLIADETKVQLLVWTTTPWTLTANMVQALL
jgi:isoleucyl-tRNA synthetase